MKTENLSLVKLAVKDLAKKVICDGHLFLSTTSGRKFYVMKPGVFIDPSFVKKHAPTATVFEFSPTSNPKVQQKFKKLFVELRYLQFEKDLRLKCLEIVKEFYETFKSEEHFLSFALAAYEEFCQLPFEHQLRMHETDMHLFRKALYASAFSVIVSMTNDYYQFTILKDFYNLTMTLDIGLCKSDYSYFVAEACNAENRKPGSGKIYLETERASAHEMAVFLNHPFLGHEFLKTHPILSYQELAEVSLYQHELSGGKGFPRGIAKGQISSWEAVVIFSDSLVEISDSYAFENNVIKYLLNFQNEKMTDLPVKRVYKKLCDVLHHFDLMRETVT